MFESCLYEDHSHKTLESRELRLWDQLWLNTSSNTPNHIYQLYIIHILTIAVYKYTSVRVSVFRCRDWWRRPASVWSSMISGLADGHAEATLKLVFPMVEERTKCQRQRKRQQLLFQRGANSPVTVYRTWRGNVHGNKYWECAGECLVCLENTSCTKVGTKRDSVA